MRMVEEDPKGHPEYTIRDGSLYRHILHTLDFNDTDPSDQWQICVPRTEQERVLREAHDEPTALNHVVSVPSRVQRVKTSSTHFLVTYSYRFMYQYKIDLVTSFFS